MNILIYLSYKHAVHPPNFSLMFRDKGGKNLIGKELRVSYRRARSTLSWRTEEGRDEKKKKGATKVEIRRGRNFLDGHRYREGVMCRVTDEFSARLDNGWSQHQFTFVSFSIPCQYNVVQRRPFDLNLDQAWWIPHCIAVSDKTSQVFVRRMTSSWNGDFIPCYNFMLIRKIERIEEPE